MIYVMNFDTNEVVKVSMENHYFSTYSLSSYATISEAFWFMPWVLNQAKGHIKLYDPVRFSEDTISSSHFRDCQKLV